MRLLLVTLLFNWVAVSGFANESFKLGLVDLQKALQNVDAGKNAKKSLEKDVTSKRTELEKRQNELQKEAEAFEKKSALLNDAAKTKKQQELQKKFMELQKEAAESQMDLQKRERELTKPIIDELRTVIEGLGKEKGLTLILEKNEGAVLFTQGGEDLTEQVIEKFNSTRKSGKKSN
ncbi:MAG: OmpH family outer membrane protein [Proteobacteria bacterium]|nr:OmpH family outer membrane protein [Pseudomonadota bacterium]